ncbi:HNH endonuclease [Mycobacterium sp. NS-7484]|uniref:HNH endonuclease n=1 Tax=Mycobacterium sp. NS-7484 TaxID=1834161 RepID=UPI00115258CB|nr:HNH endonuclease signature motif containing protein [Mycobacterium sp. NS-7484]
MCCEGIGEDARRERLVLLADKVQGAAVDYAEAGVAGQIHTLEARAYEPLAPATREDFGWLYTQRLVGSAPGRIYYDLLRDANRDGRCVLCNVKQAWTLDHHLPKAEHPIFAVTPDNLLPACRDCNSIKLASTTPTLNAYFDDLGPGPWLKVEIIPTVPCIPKFSLHVQDTWTPELTARAIAHFDQFGLSQLYTFQANRLMSGIHSRLREIFDNEGSTGVRSHLEGEARSWQLGEPNAWEAALYAGLAASDWFCSGALFGDG